MFVILCFFINNFAFYTSPFVLLLMWIYPFTKRFTFMCSFVLGFILSIAPIGGWVVVVGSIDINIYIFSLAIMLWASSFDMIYHTQDYDFQKKHDLKSFASQFGILNTFVFSVFLDLLSMSFFILFGYINELNIIYQKDNSNEWDELFGIGSWRGSECVIVQPLLFNGNNTGSIVVKSEHFSDINAKDQLLIKHLSEIISLIIKDLDILEKTINQGKDQSQIFDLLTQINLSHSESEILNKFRNIIHYFFNYDCLTISKLDSLGKKANVKLVDGIKTHRRTQANGRKNYQSDIG